MIVGYDGSDPPERAFDVAIEQAKAFRDRLVLLCGRRPGWPPRPRILGSEIGEVEQACSMAFGGAIRRAKADHLEAESSVVAGSSAEALVVAAQKHGADVIVIGTRGEGRLSGMLLGSTAYRLLHSSPVPVIVVPAPD